jgi:hypothetical protein
MSCFMTMEMILLFGFMQLIYSKTPRVSNHKSEHLNAQGT